MKDTIDVNSIECFGCGLCSKVCQMKAIEMKKNEYGFIVPNIKQSLCVNCGLCKKICPINFDLSCNELQEVFVGYSKNNIIRKKSSSGGIFFELAKLIIDDCGVVFGAAYEKDSKSIIHLSSDTYEGLNKFQGSKYVQSYFLNVFDELLISNRPVLISGTPCQIAAIKKFIEFKKIDDSNIFLVDILCHGCPSPGIFFDYINYIEKKYKKNLLYHEFRNKSQGWHKHLELNKFVDGTFDSKSYDSQLLKKIFYSSNSLRESCFHCKFASNKRISDITLGDFRGVEIVRPELDDDRGISFILINTRKGKDLFDRIHNCCLFWNSNFDEIKQPNFFHPTIRPKSIDEFRNDYIKIGFEKTIKKWYGVSLKNRILEYLYKIFKDKGNNDANKKNN